MTILKEEIKSKKLIIGMIHVEALPGTPNYKGNFDAIIEKAVAEAKIYADAGIDALAIENMHDVPYLKRKVGPEITSAMTIVGHEVKRNTGLTCGIQILAGANKEALASAKAANLDFIRAEGFVFAHTADEGLIESDAGEIMRYRKQIDAENILIFTDIKKKHSSHSITQDVDLVETGKAAEFFLSDGVIITGQATGMETSLKDIEEVKRFIDIPVLVGSGITLNNVENYLEAADALIVGSYFKEEGYWGNEVNKERVVQFMKKVNDFRGR